jgi:Transposase DDE domain
LRLTTVRRRSFLMDIIRNVSTALQAQLGTELDEIARECFVVIREREFTGRTLLLMIVVSLLQKPDATWADFHATAARLGLQISRTAVEKRFAAGEPLVEFFRRALERILRQSVIGNPVSTELLQPFTAVLIGDATTIALPDELADLFPGCGGAIGTSRAALKLQVLWDLKTGQLVKLVVEPGRASDAKSPIAVEEAAAGTLLVYDLGYFDVSRFAALDTQEAKFISRLQHGTDVFDLDGVHLDLVTYFRGQTASLVDQMILLGATVKLCCRLIAIRVPEEVANRRRQQARDKAKKKGRDPSAEYLELLGWSLFVTNGKSEDLTWKAVVVLYRARWQIELLFKLWKSHNQLERGRAGASAQEFLAVFYAKLLGVVLQHWILVATAWHIAARSLMKAAEMLADEIKEMMKALGDLDRLEELLRHLQRLIENRGKTTNRNKNPSYAQLMDDPDLLDWI